MQNDDKAITYDFEERIKVGALFLTALFLTMFSESVTSFGPFPFRQAWMNFCQGFSGQQTVEKAQSERDMTQQRLCKKYSFEFSEFRDNFKCKKFKFQF